MGKKLEFTIEKQERLTSFLASSVAGMTRAKADLLIKSGEVRVNGLRVKTNAMLEAGDTMRVFVPDFVQNNGIRPYVVYEDENIVVFDKPKRTAYDSLPELYGAPLFAVHRLDTNTTGLIVFAKTERAQEELSAAFKDRRVDKTYQAVVCPAPKEDRATLTAYTKLMPSQNTALVSDSPKPDYKTMITEYEVVERIGDAAVLEVKLHTGRTHQIRAHLAHIGCPIVGEHKYGSKTAQKLSGAPDTQMLAAVSLKFYGLGKGLQYLNGKTFEAKSGFDLSFLRDGSK
ncbi:MAG: RluA family pseudouridine synthase [Clostridiales bacterium]|nr:RluA family pseudouridine synthase [Clostridiales bacterium]